MSTYFSSSNDFSSSKTIRNRVIIKVNESKSNKKGAVIGGVVAAVGLIVGIIAFIVNRHRKLEQDSDMFIDLNPVDDNRTSITYNNVLHGLEMDDDLFEDDFHIDDH